MKPYRNIVQLQTAREINGHSHLIKERFHATAEFIDRLGLYAELDRHSGCVNCLEWSEDGRILAGGSDDVHVSIWEPFKKKLLAYIPTGHNGNIFTLKFLPNSDSRSLITGAADHSVRVHDIVAKELLRVCTCHTNRVKRAVVDPNIPYLYWSAGEDGMIIQHDMRDNHTCSSETKRPKNVMVDLRNYIGGKAEAKCLAIDPVRSEYFAVGANDPYVRIYDRRMIKLSDEGKKSDVPVAAVQYFVPGHLPIKVGEYKRKYRSLASTYVSYSPDGKELLVNLGGEQIYIFPVVGNLKQGVTSLTIPNGVINGYDSDKIVTPNGFKVGCSNELKGHTHKIDRGRMSGKVQLPPHVEGIKIKANEAFGTKKYAKAIHFYNEALKLCPDSPILYGNRAAAYLKRNWDGDMYAALQDCQVALTLDSSHHKAHLRMCRCLFELKRVKETEECLRVFKTRFPDCGSDSVTALENDLTKALTAPETNGKRKSPNSSSNTLTSSASRPRRNFLIRFQRASPERSHSNDEDEESPSRDAEPTISVEENDSRSSSETADESRDTVIDSGSSRGSARSQPTKRPPIFFENEKDFKDKAVDYQKRFCGHCNTTTDIKEANFFGDFVVGGSDDGSFFIWNRETTNIVKIINGDESIVNCLQPHPSTCCLATSGIESLIRIWQPLAKTDNEMSDRIVEDMQDAACANQRRMNSNPFEVILMNMGYRVSMNGEEEGTEEEVVDESAPVPMQCNPT